MIPKTSRRSTLPMVSQIGAGAQERWFSLSHPGSETATGVPPWGDVIRQDEWNNYKVGFPLGDLLQVN